MVVILVVLCFISVVLCGAVYETSKELEFTKKRIDDLVEYMRKER